MPSKSVMYAAAAPFYGHDKSFDPKNRWAEKWLTWPGFDPLLAQRVPRPQAARSTEVNNRALPAPRESVLI